LNQKNYPEKQTVLMIAATYGRIEIQILNY
jgi:hypothetical protein